MNKKTARRLPRTKTDSFGLDPSKLQKQIDFWRTCPVDPYGVGNAVIATLEAIKNSLAK